MNNVLDQHKARLLAKAQKLRSEGERTKYIAQQVGMSYSWVYKHLGPNPRFSTKKLYNVKKKG